MPEPQGEHPSPVAHPARADLDARSALEAELLRRRRAKTAAQPDAIPALPRCAGTTRFPASHAQESAWQLIRAQPRPSRVVLGGMRLRGPLEPAALERALNAVVARHEILRTTLEESTDGLTQVISPPSPLTVPVTEGTLADFDKFTADEVDRSLDLERGPLIRLRLLRLDADDHIVLAVLHHMIADARATEVLFNDLTIAYLAERNGQSARLAPLPLQYADYAVWQRERLTGAVREAKAEYWGRRLAGATPVPLPADGPAAHCADGPGSGPADVSSGGLPPEAGNAVVVPMPPDLFGAVRQCARAHGTTVFNGTLAAFHVLLARYSGQRDICVPVPVTVRDRSELQELIGDFSHSMLCRADLSGDPDFGALLVQVRDAFARDLDHADLHQQLYVPELPDHAALSDILSTVLFGADEEVDGGPLDDELRAEPLPPRWQYALHPLSLRLSYGPEHAQLVVTHRLREFSAERAAELAQDYLDVLAACVDRPEEKVFGPKTPALRVPGTGS